MDGFKDKFVEGQLLDGRFRTVAPLNHGSFGMVFLAKDTLTGEDVAIKCLTKSLSPETPGPLVIDDRSEELDCHAHLGYHPNIVNLIHSFETCSHTYIVLEYCSMGDLYEAIRVNRGPLETEHVRDFMLQLIDAVDFMHSNGLYHRDIKPENIFLTHDGSMKLGDFGLATRMEWCHEACVGSDRYMAPEQYEPPQGGYSPAKADIWAVGICLLNILFARNPFVTPTESDILFADYVRDRQSLFDIFPNMSQDTFEILRHALAIDPQKRSISGMRDAISRTVSFTTDDESLDEFCTEDRSVVPACANREPLRTPSIQSPHINAGDSFPWAKALQASPPQPIRQLSAIPDTEYYSEDLFPPSETAGTSWFSVHHPESPSLASVLDSAMGASFKSVAARSNGPTHPGPSTFRPIAGSLPSHTVKPMSAMSMVFGNGKRNQFSKSWSDLWDEEEEWESEDASLQQRRENNARSWSQDSKEVESPVHPVGLFEPKSSSFVNSRSAVSRRGSDSSASLPSPSEKYEIGKAGTASGSPNRGRRNSQRRSNIDKWAALGDRRRNYRPKEETPVLKKQRSMNLSWRRDSGPSGSPPRRNPFLDKEWRRFGGDTQVKPKNDYRDSVDDDLDLVGGWHDLHL